MAELSESPRSNSPIVLDPEKALLSPQDYHQIVWVVERVYTESQVEYEVLQNLA